MKSRRWAGRVARMEIRQVSTRVLVGAPEGERPVGNEGVDGTVLLNWIFKKLDGEAWTGLIWLRLRTDAGCL